MRVEVLDGLERRRRWSQDDKPGMIVSDKRDTSSTSC
jgi:hypothetical protein